ncbi:hypothetical protein BJL95_19835 [Methylomonas sp. LWB]|uniref:nucleoid-associated protein n=1 Tax=Methylomonas sp. LWB TaxID=1905845 RepID=UPI0008D93E8D|nr:nucleoid-associated protein [Methylomonas sp. LWB]OHX36949.1 hypothetical protein BJL95_19835 [Methylomonas sp. LWB]
MIIQEAIVHRFDKDRHKPSVAKMRDEVLPNEDNLQNLVGGIRDVFNRTMTRGYGAFKSEDVAYPFSDLLDKYLKDQQGLGVYTLGLKTCYQKAIDGASLATGGYLFFARYQENGQDFMFVVSLKLKAGTGIDDTTLTINKTVNFDIDHLHEAARINLTAWKAGNDRYVTFIKKRRSGEDSKSATDYFRDFLGVTELTESAEQTKLLLQVVRDYCEEKQFEVDKAREIRQRVHAYCVECTKEKKGISLDALSMRLDDQQPASFSEFVTSKDYPLGDGFEPNSRIYRGLRRHRIKDSKLTLDFEESILGSRVIYDDLTETLIIKDLPLEFKQRLKPTSTESDDPT